MVAGEVLQRKLVFNQLLMLCDLRLGFKCREKACQKEKMRKKKNPCCGLV